MRVTEEYIFTHLCENIVTGFCLKPYVAQFPISSKPIPIIYNYTDNSSQDHKGDSISFNENYFLQGFDTVSVTQVIENQAILWQNAFFSPIMYVDKKYHDLHLVYFSGHGDVTGPGCGDIILHDIIISSSKILKYTHNLKVVWRKEPLHSISDYASLQFSMDNTPYYLLHGGLSCYSRNIVSTLFVIALDTFIATSVPQISPISGYI